ncbi:MAG: hypothetical protein ACOY5B_14545 [Spirochaetota bacterium]
MAKKVFYNRRYKMPAWGQPYAVWAVVAIITLSIVFFTSVETVPSEPAATLPASVNGFAEGLFYELRDAETGSEWDAAEEHIERLKKKHNYRSREESIAGCRGLTLVRGSAPQWKILAAVQKNRSEGIYAAMVFLDRIGAQASATAISATLVFPRKGCDAEAAVRTVAGAEAGLPVFVDAGGEAAAAHYDRIPALRNLRLRRHFPHAFLMPERTLWANVLALSSETAGPELLHLPADKWKDGVAATIATNPLLAHPAISGVDAAELTRPAALYLGQQTQLTRGGFVALCVIVWLFAFIPLANALSTFRERMEPGSALTSGLLYGLAFIGYFLFFKLVLKYTRTDFATITLAIVLVPVVFFPLRVLQKTMLRAELNRPGLHLLIQTLLTVALFLSPGSALLGLLLLAAASAYVRASLPRKMLRLLIVGLVFAVFWYSTKEPLGNFTNYLGQYLPSLSAAQLPAILLLSMICGNIIALLFVPRERT